MIQICAFKEKEKEGGERKPQLGGQWKVPMLGGQWGSIFLGGQWKALMFNGPWKEKEKHPFHLFSLSPKQISLKLFFH
jgi:hypothetical protein